MFRQGMGLAGFTNVCNVGWQKFRIFVRGKNKGEKASVHDYLWPDVILFDLPHGIYIIYMLTFKKKY